MIKTQPPTQPSDTVRKVTEISHEELPPMPKKSAFMFNHNLYLKAKNRLKRC